MRRISVLVYLFLMLGLFPAPAAAQDNALPWPTDGWQISTPEAQGIDSQQLAAVFDRIAERNINIHSLLVIRNGYLVLEAYRYPYTPDMPHAVYSTTKSFTSALIGIAMAQGYIKSVDQPGLDWFTDRTIANLDSSKQSVTLENLLTMTSGLDWPTAPLERPAMLELINSPDWVQFMLDRPMRDTPGERFVYNSGASHLLAVIVEEATGKSLLDFAQANLFDPLGIHPGDWWVDPQGHYIGGTGLFLTPRDMAKFGYLFLNNGQWDGQQIIPADWVAASTQKHVAGQPYTDSYGYQWWVDSLHGYYMTAGYGGQHIIVDPDKNLVAVFTSALKIPDTNQPITLFLNYIVPTIQSDDPLPDNPSGQAALTAASDALANPLPVAVPPLPDMAAELSGKTYTLEDNPGDWKSLRLAFTQGADTALLMLDDEPPLDIGLDDRFRVNPDYPGGTLFAKGSWKTDKRFVIQLEVAGLVDGVQWTLNFDGESLKITSREGMTGNTLSFEGEAA